MKQTLGIGLPGIVFVVFLTMKLAEVGAVASWSWWWVTCPLWAPPTMMVSGLVCMLACAGIVAGVGWVVSSIANWIRVRRMLRGK